MQAVEHHVQHLHAGFGLWADPVCAEDDFDVPRERLTSRLRTRLGEYLLMDYMQRKMKTIH